MKSGISILLLSCLLFPFQAQGLTIPPLSDGATLSLLTTAPGDEVYSLFGHSAIRIKDDKQGIDATFNWGTFDFSDDSFFTNFALGRLDYILSASSMRHYVRSYSALQRQTYEIVLQLSPAQLESVRTLLNTNLQPQNLRYRYDYYRDNCATRIRDLFVNALGSDLILPTQIHLPQLSYRQWTDRYALAVSPWADVGIDLALGVQTDHVNSYYEAMFLPDNLEHVLRKCMVKNRNGKVVPFVKQRNLITEGYVRAPVAWYTRPVPLLCVLLIGVVWLTYRDYRRAKISRWIDVFVFGIPGLLGLFLTFLWFGTSHEFAAWNFNLLWAWPTHTLFIAIAKRPNVSKLYHLATISILSGIVIFWLLLPQRLPDAALPISIMILCRSLLRLMPEKQRRIKPVLTV